VTPLEETIGALGELIAAGKVVHWGFSNFRAWKIAEMIRVADSLGVARPVASQPYYHTLNRVVEMEYLPACLHFGIGAVAYSPLARGVLTGKYRGGVIPEGSRAARKETRIMETEFRDETIAAANRAADHATATGRDAIGLAIQWVLANSAVPSVLIGPKSLAQLEAYLGAATTGYTAEDAAVLSALCASGHTPVPGHSDPRYPSRGRLTEFAAEGAPA
jgi:aryl-alcohol dehydrogenase-like predicted oxidoreductase